MFLVRSTPTFWFWCVQFQYIDISAERPLKQEIQKALGEMTEPK